MPQRHGQRRQPRQRQRYRQVLECIEIAADIFRQPDHDVEAAISFKHGSRGSSADGRSDDVLNSRETETSPRDLGLVHADIQHRKAAGLFDLNVGRSFGFPQNIRNLPRATQERFELIAENLHGEIAAHAGQQLIEAHLDRLGEFVVVAGQLAHRVRDLVEQRGLGQFGIGPLVLRLEDNEGIRRTGRHRIGSDFGCAGLGENVGDLRKRADDFLDVELHRLRLRQACAGNAQRVHGDVLFIQRRDELLTKPEKQQQRTDEQNQSGRDSGGGPFNSAPEQGRI